MKRKRTESIHKFYKLIDSVWQCPCQHDCNGSTNNVESISLEVMLFSFLYHAPLLLPGYPRRCGRFCLIKFADLPPHRFAIGFASAACGPSLPHPAGFRLCYCLPCLRLGLLQVAISAASHPSHGQPRAAVTRWYLCNSP